MANKRKPRNSGWRELTAEQKGLIISMPAMPCPVCRGTGKLSYQDRVVDEAKLCATCKGSGKL